jgi:hypothetical protein
MAEFCTIFWSNLDEAYSISYLRIASRNHGCGADLVFIQPENQTDLRSYLHREHHLNVAAGEADLVSCCALRRHILSRMHFNRNKGFYAGESPSFLRSIHFPLSSPGNRGWCERIHHEEQCQHRVDSYVAKGYISACANLTHNGSILECRGATQPNFTTA